MTITIKDDTFYISLDTSKEPVREAIKILPKTVINTMHPHTKVDEEIDLMEVPHSTGYKYATTNLLTNMSDVLSYSETRAGFNMWVRNVIIMAFGITAMATTNNVSMTFVTLFIVVFAIALNVIRFYRMVTKWRLAIETLRHHFAQEYAYYLYLDSDHLKQTIKDFKTLVGIKNEKEYKDAQCISQLEALLKQRDVDINALSTQGPNQKEQIDFLESTQRALSTAYNDILNSISSKEVSTHIERCKKMGVELNIVSVDADEIYNEITPNKTIH